MLVYGEQLVVPAIVDGRPGRELGLVERLGNAQRLVAERVVVPADRPSQARRGDGNRLMVQHGEAFVLGGGGQETFVAIQRALSVVAP